jgi:deazaflavin-dependent oxidoreductase (nitroreductase family)
MSEFGARRTYRPGRWRAAGNAVMCAVTRAGVIPHTYLLTTIGRSSGEPRFNPVTIVEVGGSRWLVAPYGPVNWVRNARAAGEVQISRRGSVGTFAIREVDDPDEAAPILRRYVEVASATREFFAARVGDPLPTFAAEATAHPVFELIPREARESVGR